MIVCPFKDLGRYAPIIPGLEEAMNAVAAMTEWVPGTIQQAHPCPIYWHPLPE